MTAGLTVFLAVLRALFDHMFEAAFATLLQR
jgi:hypothetical protein